MEEAGRVAVWLVSEALTRSQKFAHVNVCRLDAEAREASTARVFWCDVTTTFFFWFLI